LKQDDIHATIEEEVRYANITIIEGMGASQYCATNALSFRSGSTIQNMM